MWIDKFLIFIFAHVIKLHANDGKGEDIKNGSSQKFLCPDAGVFPDPSDDCKHYHHCRRLNDTPIATLICAANELFDTFEKECVPEKDANCINCQKDGIMKDMHDAHFFITCKGGTAERHPCEPEGSVFNEDELVCELKEDVSHKRNKNPMRHHPAFNNFGFKFHADFLQVFEENKKRIWGSRHSHLKVPSIKVDTVAQAGEARASAVAVSRGETSAGLAHSQASLGAPEKITGKEVFKGLGLMGGESSNVHAMATATRTGGNRGHPVEVKSSESEEHTKKPYFYLKEDTIQLGLGKHGVADKSRSRKHKDEKKHERRRRQAQAPWVQNNDLGQMISDQTNRIIAQGFAGASSPDATFNGHHSQNQWQSFGAASQGNANVAYESQQQSSLTQQGQSVQNSGHAAQSLAGAADQPDRNNLPVQVEGRSLQQGSSVVHGSSQHTNHSQESSHMQKTDHDEEHILILHHQNRANHQSDEHTHSDEHSESDEKFRHREDHKSSKKHKGRKTSQETPNHQDSEEDADEQHSNEPGSDEHSQEDEDHESEEHHRDAAKNDKGHKSDKSKSSAKKNSERNHRDSSEEHHEVVVEWERMQARKKQDHKHHPQHHTTGAQKNSSYPKAVTVPKQGRNAHHERQTTRFTLAKPTEKSAALSEPATIKSWQDSHNHSQVRKETEAGNTSVTERTESQETTTQSSESERISNKKKSGTKSGRGIWPAAAKQSTIEHNEVRETTEPTKDQTTAQPTKGSTKSVELEDGKSTLKPVILASISTRFTRLDPRKKWWESVPTIVPLPTVRLQHDNESGHHSSSNAEPATKAAVILTETTSKTLHARETTEHPLTIAPTAHNEEQNHAVTSEEKNTKGSDEKESKRKRKSKTGRRVKFTGGNTGNRKFSGRKKGSGSHMGRGVFGLSRTSTITPKQGSQFQPEPPESAEKCKNCRTEASTQGKFGRANERRGSQSKSYRGVLRRIRGNKKGAKAKLLAEADEEEGNRANIDSAESSADINKKREKRNYNPGLPGKSKDESSGRIKETTNRNTLASGDDTLKSGGGRHRGRKNSTGDKKNSRLAKGETKNDKTTAAPIKLTVKKNTTHSPRSTSPAPDSTTQVPDSTTQLPDNPKTTRKRKRKTIKKKRKVHKKKCVKKNKKAKNDAGSRSLHEHVDWMPEVTEEPVTEWIDVTEWETVTEIVDYVDESKTKKPKKHKKFRLKLNEGERWAESKAIAGSTSDAFSVGGGSSKDSSPNSRVMADAVAMVWSAKGKAASDPSSDQRDHRKKPDCPNPPCKFNFAQAESRVSSRSSSARHGSKMNADQSPRNHGKTLSKASPGSANSADVRENVDSKGKRPKRHVQLSLKPHNTKNGIAPVPAWNVLLVGIPHEGLPGHQIPTNTSTPPQNPDPVIPHDPRISKRAVDVQEEVEETPRPEKRLRKKCKKKFGKTQPPKETTEKPRKKKTKKPKKKLNSEEIHSPLVEQVQKGLNVEPENTWTLSNKIDPFDFNIEPAGFHDTNLLPISRTFGHDNDDDSVINPDWATGQEHPDSPHIKIQVSYEKTFGVTNTSSFKTAFITDQGDDNGTITSGTSENQDRENSYSTEKKQGSEKTMRQEKSRKEEKFAASQTAKDGTKQMSADAKVEHHENASVSEFDQHTGDKKVEVREKKLLKVNTTKSDQGLDGIIKTTSNGSTNGSENVQSTYTGSNIIIQENVNKKLLSQDRLVAQKEGSKEKKLLTSKLVFSDTQAKHANDSGVVQQVSKGNSVTSDVQVSNITDGKDGQSMIMNNTYATETQSHKNKTGELETAISHQKSRGSEGSLAVTEFNGTAKITDFSTLIGGDTTSKINKTKGSEVISNLHSQISKHTDRQGAIETSNGNRTYAKFTVQREDDAKQTLTVVERTNDDKGRPRTEKITERNRSNILNMKEDIKNLTDLNTHKSKVDTATTGNRSVISSGSEILTLLSPEGKRLETIVRAPSIHKRVQILDNATSKDDHADNNSEETNCAKCACTNCECTACGCTDCQVSPGEVEKPKNDVNSKPPSQNSAPFVSQPATHQLHIPESPETDHRGSEHISQPHSEEDNRNDTEPQHSHDKNSSSDALFEKDQVAAAHAAAGRQDGPAVAIVASHSADKLSEAGSVAAAGNGVARASAQAKLHKNTEESNHGSAKNDTGDWAKIEMPHLPVTR